MPEPPQVKASLGCGTLILIAIIVLVFGGHRDHKELEEKIDALQLEVEGLRADLQDCDEGDPPGEKEETAVRLP